MPTILQNPTKLLKQNKSGATPITINDVNKNTILPGILYTYLPIYSIMINLSYGYSINYNVIGTQKNVDTEKFKPRTPTKLDPCPRIQCPDKKWFNPVTCECECDLYNGGGIITPRRPLVECEGLKERNYETCECECEPIDCDTVTAFGELLYPDQGRILDENCNCVCPPMDCSPPKEVNEECECVCIESDAYWNSEGILIGKPESYIDENGEEQLVLACSGLQVRNPETCECECEPTDCSQQDPLTYYDTENCICTCPPIDCGEKAFPKYDIVNNTCGCECFITLVCESYEEFNPETCECEPLESPTTEAPE